MVFVVVAAAAAAAAAFVTFHLLFTVSWAKLFVRRNLSFF